MSLVLCLAAALSTVLVPEGPTSSSWMWGVTVDNIQDSQLIFDSLKRMPKRPTVRVVFDEGMNPDYYRSAVTLFGSAADLMGEPIDSVQTKNLSTSQYRSRMALYMANLKDVVGLWEIGNEVNGDWCGDSKTVAAKVTGAYQEAKSRNLKTALTLFQSAEDAYRNTDRDLVTWSQKYLSAATRDGIDYVLISFYPLNERGVHPNWNTIFSNLASLYPNAKLGFGELGLAQADYSLSKDTIRNAYLVQRYYGMRSPIADRYIGGYFWWSFRQDSVPAQTPIWNCIARAMTNRGR